MICFFTETLRTRAWKRQTLTRPQFQDVDYEPVPSHEEVDDGDDEMLVDQVFIVNPYSSHRSCTDFLSLISV